jgi:hypothetical protein
MLALFSKGRMKLHYLRGKILKSCWGVNVCNTLGHVCGYLLWGTSLEKNQVQQIFQQ